MKISPQIFTHLRSFLPYMFLLFFLIILSIVGQGIFAEQNTLLDQPDFQIFIIGTIIFIGFVINRIAPKTIVPSFVWVIFAGMALEPLLQVFTSEIELLSLIMELFAAMILFSGGLEVPFKNFQRWFYPIATLSFIGVILTSLLFSFIMYGLSILLGVYTPDLLPSIVILSVALASTDPTAIIPMMDVMKFKRPHLKQIAISESALTDISGSILTRFLLIAFISTSIAGGGLLSYFSPLLQANTYEAFSLQIVSGILIGFIGYKLLKHLYNPQVEYTADPGLFLAVPIFTFVLGNALGGAGFLAAFVAGLFTDLSGEIHNASHFNDKLLQHLVHPFIFIILGALVPFQSLITYAPLGIMATLIFIFIIRPIVVGSTLFPWILKHDFQWRDIAFLAMIRETGIIAAVLLVIASSHDIIVSDFVLAIGMWVILLTLILEPPFTPLISKRIGVTE